MRTLMAFPFRWRAGDVFTALGPNWDDWKEPKELNHRALKPGCLCATQLFSSLRCSGACEVQAGLCEPERCQQRGLVRFSFGHEDVDRSAFLVNILSNMAFAGMNFIKGVGSSALTTCFL